MTGANKVDRLVVTERRLAAIEWASGSVAHIAPGRNLADEIVADRRRSATSLGRPGEQEPPRTSERSPD